MKKYFITLSILIAIFCLFFPGCGGDSNVTILPTTNPITSPTPSSSYPLSDQKLQFLTDREISSGQGMPSKQLGHIAQCINTSKIYPSSKISGQGIAFEIVEIGDMLYSIYKDLQVESNLEKIDEEIQALGEEIAELNQKLDDLSTQLALTQVNIQTYISSLNVQNYITPIKTAYSTTSEVGLVYYSSQAVLNDSNSPLAVPLSTLQNQEKVYIANVTSASGIAVDIQGIHDSICPDLSSLNGVLKDYTNKIILDSSQNGNNQNVKDPKNVMSTYLLLETYYAQLLTYQFQGATILTNAYNCQDPTGNQTRSYMNGTFKTLLKDEMARYLATVDYMVVNLVDYRDPNTYAQDMAYQMQGLAADNLYLNVLARSRFFCAQIMQAYEDDFSLYGAIVAPYDYTGGANITLTFQGSSTFNKTMTPEQIAGVYPYTKWTDSKGTVAPDNQWLFYNMSSIDPNIPAGTYQVSFTDSGSTSPWPHTNNLLGTVSVKYYDPNNPDPATATTTPTETNTLKFGYFSLKWPWGFQKLCSSPISDWTIPSGSSYTYPPDQLNPIGYTSDVDNPNYDSIKNYVFSPASNKTGFINSMYMYYPSQSVSRGLLRYVINMPIIPAGAPNDSSTVSGKFIYHNFADISTSASESKAIASTQYNFLFNDHTKKKTEKILTYTSDNHSIDINDSSKGLTNFTIYKGSNCDVSVDMSYFEQAYKSSNGAADMSIIWYMQFIYTNTYNIFQ